MQKLFDYDFRGAAGIAAAVRHGPTPTYTRGAAGWYVTDGGVLTEAATDVPRITALGLLFDSGQVTNLAQNDANTFSAAGWTKNNVSVAQDATGQDGGTSAWTLTDANNGDDYLRRTLTVADSTALHGHAIRMKAGTASIGRLTLIYTTGGTLTIYQVVVDLSAGTIGFTTDGAQSGIVEIADGIYEFFLAAPNTGDGNTQMLCDIRVGVDDAATGTVIIERSFIFDGDRPPMWHPDDPGDSILQADLPNALPDGCTLFVSGSWDWKPRTFSRQLVVSDESTSNFATIQVDGNRSLITHIVKAGVDQMLLGPGVTPDDNETVSMALRLKSGDFMLALSDGSSIKQASGAVPAGLTRLDLGHNSLGINGFFTGFIGRAVGVDRALSDEEMLTLATTGVLGTDSIAGAIMAAPMRSVLRNPLSRL